MSIETLHQLELLLHVELSKALANRETANFSKLSSAWIEIWKEMDNHLSSHEGALLEQEVFVSQTFATNSEDKWLTCFSYTQLQVGDKVRWIDERGDTKEETVEYIDADENDTVVVYNDSFVYQKRISHFLPVQQQ